MRGVIYRILNINTGKNYIGSTVNFRKRRNQHLHHLRGGKHHSKRLQNSWNKHGEPYFKFEIIAEHDSDLLEFEQFYINLFDSYNSGYNSSSSSYAPSHETVWTDEKKRDMGSKVSAALKGKTPKNITLMRESQRRPILELEDGKLIREYESAKQAGEILCIDYKCINNVLTGRTKINEKYSNKTWVYKDGQGVREVRR